MGAVTVTSIGPTAADLERPLEPLWRGLLVYRVLTLLAAFVAVWRYFDHFGSPAGVVAVQVAMAAWTVATGFAYLGERAAQRRRWFAVVDLAVTLAVLGTTPLVETAAQVAADEPVMGSIWTACALLACALAWGVRGGLLAAVVMSVELVAVQSGIDTELGDIQLLLMAGITVGFAATVLRRSGERLRRAIASEAAMAERERLARQVHDGVLQVLGFVRRRGAELGGPAGELGALAGEQEFALRTLLVNGPATIDADGRRDLASALRTLASTRVSVSAPAGVVTLPALTVEELVAVVGAALSNVTVHVGTDAPAWVLLEDTSAGVEISVRDEGPGIAPGRLVAAAQEGRMGVSRSMQGRVQDLGGSIECDSGPGRGTEWIIKLPRETR